MMFHENNIRILALWYHDINISPVKLGTADQLNVYIEEHLFTYCL